MEPQVGSSACVFADTRTPARPRVSARTSHTRAPVGTPEPSEGLRACRVSPRPAARPSVSLAPFLPSGSRPGGDGARVRAGVGPPASRPDPDSRASLFLSPAGSVTGNSNSVYFSGQVMNFKGDIIVVYVSQNSGRRGPSAREETAGRPVQEESPPGATRSPASGLPGRVPRPRVGQDCCRGPRQRPAPGKGLAGRCRSRGGRRRER